MSNVTGCTAAMAQSPAKRHNKGEDALADEADAVSTVAPSDADALSVFASSDGADAVSAIDLDPAHLWETAAGNRVHAGEALTEANLGDFEHGLGKISEHIHQQHEQMVGEEELVPLNKVGAKKFAALKNALDEGKMESTSYLAKTFRAALDDDSMKSFSKLGRVEQAKFRLDWAKAQYGSFREAK
jgi:hypothetical protein